MSVFFVVADTEEITIISDSQSSTLDGRCIEHGVQKIWDYDDMLVGIAGNVAAGKFVVECAHELSEESTSFTAWGMNLQTVLQDFYSDPDTKILRPDQFSTLITVAARSDERALALLRIDLLQGGAEISRIELLAEPQVYIVPPKDFGENGCRELFESMCRKIQTDTDQPLRHQLRKAARMAVQEIADRSQYVDNIVQEKTLQKT